MKEMPAGKFKAHCLAVKKFLVAACALNRVPDSMTEVEKRSFTGAISLILCDNRSFDFNVALDE